MLRRGTTFKDKVYDHQQWEHHKRNRRHCPGPLSCVRVVRSVFWPMLFATLIAVLIGIYHDVVQVRVGWLPHLADYEGLSTVFDITSFALALLLVFRTNACYARWWEARILWGNQLNTSRNLIRQVLTWPDTPKPGLQKAICRWIQALSVSHKAFLRGEADLKEQLQRVLTPKEVTLVVQSDHAPNACALMLSSLIVGLDLELFRAIEADLNVTRLIDIYGGCERILKTPVPLSYTRHTSQFLMIWLCLVPLGLWTVCQWFTPPVCCVVAFLLLGIENIGVQIEQPFQVLPLDAMCGSVKSSMTQAMNQHLAIKDLAQAASKQFGSQPSGTIASGVDTDLATPHAVNVKRSISHNPSASSFMAQESTDSDSSIESTALHPVGRRMKGCHARRMYSLPVENHMSTRDLLSAEQHTANSSEVRLDVNA